MHFVWLISGLLFLVLSGELLVRGASSLARQFGVSPLVIGMTVVAFGTSAPELAVNVMAGLEGQGDISFGNIIGSNIANIGLIVGFTAMVMPLPVKRSIVAREIPMMILATAVTVWLFAFDRLTGGIVGISRVDGVILLIGLAAFLYRMARNARQDKKDGIFLEELEEVEVEVAQGKSEKKISPPVAVLYTLIGLAGLIGSSKMTVLGAVGIAEGLGVPPAIIGLTLVAIGTSLPELTTSIMALRKGHADLAIGNVVGSNILNLVCILGVTSLIRPIELPDGGWNDLAFMSVLSLVLLPLAFTRGRINRWEGLLLFAGYWGYSIWRFP